MGASTYTHMFSHALAAVLLWFGVVLPVKWSVEMEERVEGHFRGGVLQSTGLQEQDGNLRVRREPVCQQASCRASSD